MQVCYPSDESLRDYLSWRQADCHINNQYNACFWALVQRGGLSREAAQARLAGTLAAEKNELLFSQFSLNYATLPDMHRKGSLLRRATAPEAVKTREDGSHVMRPRTRVVVQHVDIIGDAFWRDNAAWMCGLFCRPKTTLASCRPAIW